jgi:hypothetical protein
MLLNRLIASPKSSPKERTWTCQMNKYSFLSPSPLEKGWDEASLASPKSSPKERTWTCQMNKYSFLNPLLWRGQGEAKRY